MLIFGAVEAQATQKRSPLPVHILLQLLGVMVVLPQNQSMC